MHPQTVTVDRVINTPFDDPFAKEIKLRVTVEFDPPLPLISEEIRNRMLNMLRTEAQYAAVVAVEKAML